MSRQPFEYWMVLTGPAGPTVRLKTLNATFSDYSSLG